MDGWIWLISRADCLLPVAKNQEVEKDHLYLIVSEINIFICILFYFILLIIILEGMLLYQIGVDQKNELTIFCPLLTNYLPLVDICQGIPLLL